MRARWKSRSRRGLPSIRTRLIGNQRASHMPHGGPGKLVAVGKSQPWCEGARVGTLLPCLSFSAGCPWGAGFQLPGLQAFQSPSHPSLDLEMDVQTRYERSADRQWRRRGMSKNMRKRTAMITGSPWTWSSGDESWAWKTWWR